MTFIKDIMNMTPEEITRAEWRMVAHTLLEAQHKFAELGFGRQTWMDGAIGVATERGKEPLENND